MIIGAGQSRDMNLRIFRHMEGGQVSPSRSSVVNAQFSGTSMCGSSRA
jgi:hypothetical protein